MKKKGIYFLVLAFSFYFFPVQAQISLSSPTLTVDPGIFFPADITTASFNQIQGIQFSLNWDPTVLEFQGVENFGLELNDVNFGAGQVGEGKLAFLWYDEGAAGVTLEDDEVLFSLRFKVIGAPGDTTSVVFSGDPTSIEIFDINENILTPEFTEGTITVFDPSATSFVSDPALITMDPVAPNPFLTDSRLHFELKEATQAMIAVYSPEGKRVFAENRFFTPGSHTLFFNEDIFPFAGTYFFQMTAPEFTVTQKLVRL